MAQVATDALVSMEKAMKRDGIQVNDRQLACAKIHSQEGQVRPPHPPLSLSHTHTHTRNIPWFVARKRWAGVCLATGITGGHRVCLRQPLQQPWAAHNTARRVGQC